MVSMILFLDAIIIVFFIYIYEEIREIKRPKKCIVMIIICSRYYTLKKNIRTRRSDFYHDSILNDVYGSCCIMIDLLLLIKITHFREGEIHFKFFILQQQTLSIELTKLIGFFHFK
jgi:hypothetical protein